MLKPIVERIYDDFVKQMKYQKREAQVNVISYCLLSFYEKGPKTIIIEAPTGTGKTLSYLFPLVVKRFYETDESIKRELDLIPQIVTSQHSKLYFLEDNNIDFLKELKDDNMEMIIPDKIHFPQKVYIVTHSKLLQEQIKEEIGRVNRYLKTKRMPPLTYSFLIGKRNYLCHDNIDKAISLLKENKSEEGQAPLQGEFKEFNEIKSMNETKKEAILFLLNFMKDQKIYLTEDLRVELRKLLRDRREEIPDKIYREVERLSKDVNVENLFDEIESVSGVSITSPAFFSHRCWDCEKKDCPRRQDIKRIAYSDVVVMNYFAFFAFLNALARVDRRNNDLELQKQIWEKRGLNYKDYERIVNGDIEGYLSSFSKKEIEEFKRFMEKYLSNQFNQQIISDLGKFAKKGTLSDVQFIFDEAHLMKEALVDFLATTFDVKKLSKRLQEKAKVINTIGSIFELDSERVLKVGELSGETVRKIKSHKEKIEKIGRVRFYINFLRDIFSETIASIYNEFIEMKNRKENVNVYTFENIASKLISSAKKYLANRIEPELREIGDFINKLEKEIAQDKKANTEYKDLACCLHLLENASTALQLTVRNYKELSQSPFLSKSFFYQFPIGTLERIAEDLSTLESAIRIYMTQKGYLSKKEGMAGEVGISGWEIFLLTGKTIDNFFKFAFQNNWPFLKKIITSATLSFDPNSDDPFKMIKEELEIPSEFSAEIIIDSPFDLKRQAVLFVPEDVPVVIEGGVYTEEWKNYVRQNLERIIFSLDGGTLILCSSRELHDFFNDIILQNKDNWEVKYGKKIAIFNAFSKRKEVIEKFGICDKTKEKHILIGMKSYFQGFDAKGDRLTSVIIPKIPFAEPNSKMQQFAWERVKREMTNKLVKCGKNYLEAERIASSYVFRNKIIPDALIKYAQAVGRLIRSEEDKGICICLDKRVFEYFPDKAPVFQMPTIRQWSDFQRAVEYLTQGEGSFEKDIEREEFTFEKHKQKVKDEKQRSRKSGGK